MEKKSKFLWNLDL